jgi:superfamily I DNA/RNA helicase
MKNTKIISRFERFCDTQKATWLKLPSNSRNAGNSLHESTEKLPKKARDTEVKSVRGKFSAPPLAAEFFDPDENKE